MTDPVPTVPAGEADATPREVPRGVGVRGVALLALVLAGLSGQFMNLPELGEPLARIFSNYAIAVAGAALMIVTKNVWRRFKP